MQVYSLSATDLVQDFFIRQEIDVALPNSPLYVLWIFPLGLLFSFIGGRWGKYCNRDVIRFYNKENGQVSEWTTVLGFRRERLRVSPYERIHVPKGETLSSPASLSLLNTLPSPKFSVRSSAKNTKWNSFATETCYLTLLDLLSRKKLTLYYASIAENWLFGQQHMRHLIILGPGPKNSPNVTGRLERLFVTTANRVWSVRCDWFCRWTADIHGTSLLEILGTEIFFLPRPLGDTYMRIHDALCDVISYTAGEGHQSVGKALVDDILAPDASRQGLIDLGIGPKVTVHVRPDRKADLTTSYQSLKELDLAFTASHPGIAKAMRREIARGIRASTDNS